jgi:hypothetical protein
LHDVCCKLCGGVGRVVGESVIAEVSSDTFGGFAVKGYRVLQLMNNVKILLKI